jgi:hypothetical protein
LILKNFPLKIFFQFLVIKSLDPDPDWYSAEMLYPDPESMNLDPQHCRDPSYTIPSSLHTSEIQNCKKREFLAQIYEENLIFRTKGTTLSLK